MTHLAELVKAEMRSSTSESYKASGDLHHWPEQWATDSLYVARTRVFNIELADGCIIRSEKAPHDPLHVKSRIVTPASKTRYLQSHKEDAKIQLTTAAVRLTDLLNHIAWK
ncbi:hypothetical protein [Nitrospira sp. Nam80]